MPELKRLLHINSGIGKHRLHSKTINIAFENNYQSRNPNQKGVVAIDVPTQRQCVKVKKNACVKIIYFFLAAF